MWVCVMLRVWMTGKMGIRISTNDVPHCPRKPTKPKKAMTSVVSAKPQRAPRLREVLSSADHTRAQKTSEKTAEERREMGREKMELSPVCVVLFWGGGLQMSGDAPGRRPHRVDTHPSS